jgi:GNAT superfamily N-acetyltransferase
MEENVPWMTMTEESIVRAIEGNAAELMLAMGRAGGAEERDDPSVRWTVGGSPIDYHNCVVHAVLTPDTVDRTIHEFLSRLGLYGVPGTWHLGPSMRPTDLGFRLSSYGFGKAGSESGMAMDLDLLNVPVAHAPDVTIVPVADRQTLSVWTRALGQGFGEGPREADWVGSIYEQIGLDETAPCRSYLGYWDGRPVATASLFFGSGVAGVYFVSTVPSHRRRGLGTSITLAVLQDARERGYQVGVLCASTAGRSVYQRIGFREFCRFDIYEWRSRSGT